MPDHVDGTHDFLSDDLLLVVEIFRSNSFRLRPQIAIGAENVDTDETDAQPQQEDDSPGRYESGEIDFSFHDATSSIEMSVSFPGQAA